MWSYISHGAQCGVITSHSTYCGYCVRGYHISFQPLALSNTFVTTLCLKDPWKGVDTIQLDLLLTQRIEKTCCLTTTKIVFIETRF